MVAVMDGMQYTRRSMRHDSWKLWAASGLSAGLLELPFPLAGPMPPWRSVFAWFGLVPLLWAILSSVRESPNRCALHFCSAYVCGVLWYMGNCYWIYDTMLIHGGLPPPCPALLLLGFSLVLGVISACLGWVWRCAQRRLGTMLALAAAPFLWVGLELAARKITSVPWDQLGYSQVDNAIVTQLAPWTGVYGISFVLVAVNALLAGGLVLERADQSEWIASAAIARRRSLLTGALGLNLHAANRAPTCNRRPDPAQPRRGRRQHLAGPGEWNSHIAEFTSWPSEQCKTYIAGIPQTGAPKGEIVCPPYPTHPDLVAWPESPAPFFEADPRFQQALSAIARAEQAPLVVGSIGMDYRRRTQGWH